MKRTVFEPEHEQFRASVREFVDREVAPLLETMIEERQIPRTVWQRAGELGLLGLDIPEEHGGMGACDFRFNAVATEELARLSAGIASCLGIHYDIVTQYFVHQTTEEQRKRWLPGLASGEYVAAIAMTEPSGGSDLAAMRTTATRSEGGWSLRGAKTFVTNGGSADLVLVAARTDPAAGARGITLFAVEGDMLGFSRGHKLDKVGQHESDTAELFFDEVRLPDDHRVGEEGAGFYAMMGHLTRERVHGAVSNLAHARQILDETVDYCHRRTAFGRPIGGFQHNKFLLAELVTQLDVSQTFVDQCIATHAAGELDSVDAAKAKWWTAQVQNDVLDACVQLHGGYGYMREERVARAWADARITKIWGGTNEIMKELVGRDLGF